MYRNLKQVQKLSKGVTAFELAGQIGKKTGALCDPQSDSISPRGICDRFCGDEFYAESAELAHSGAGPGHQRTGLADHILGSDPAQHEPDLTDISCTSVLLAGVSAGEDMGDLPL